MISVAGARAVIFDIFAIDRASEIFKHVGESAEHMGSRFGPIGEKMGKAFVAPLAIAAAGTVALGAAMFEGTKSAIEYQKLQAQTGAVLKSTGGAANVNATQIKDLAGRISEYSGIQDEVVQGGANLLLTFTNIKNGVGKGNDVFNQATVALTDMTVALGEDPKAAAIQLGKALNDPIKGVTALQRVGVSFTAGQKEQIKTMQAAGNTMGAQRLILGELNKEFGGSAKAAGGTFAGSLSKLKNVGEDLLRDVMLPLLPVLAGFANVAAKNLAPALDWVKGKVHLVSDAVKPLVGWFRDSLLPALNTAWKTILPALVSAFDNVKSAVTGGTGNFDDLRAKLKQVGDFVTGTVIPDFTNIAKNVLPKVGTAVGDIINGLTALVKYVSDNRDWLTPILVAIGTMTGLWIACRKAIKLWQEVTKTATAVQAAFNVVMDANPIGLVIVLLAGLAVGLVYAYEHSKTFRDVLSGVWHVIKKGAMIAFSGILDYIGMFVDAASHAFGWIPGIGPKLKTAAAEFDTFKNRVTASLNAIPDKTVHVNVVSTATGRNLGRQVPGFAVGTDYAPGGMAWVGERGPELVNLPAGSQVHTAAQSSSMLSRSSRMHPDDIAALADAIAARPITLDGRKVSAGLAPHQATAAAIYDRRAG